MPALPELQTRTLDALRHGGAAATARATALLRDGPGLPAARRLQVYRANFYESLTAALAAIYPVLVRLLGDDCFAQLARRYIRDQPPRAATLLAYGDAMPRFVRRLDALAGLPYLADVAALEWAYHLAYHDAEQPALDIAAVAALPAAQQPALRLRLQPCARLLASRWPVLAIWQANQPEAAVDAPPINLDTGGVQLLVVQHALEIEFHLLDAAEHRWLRALQRGRTLAQATAAALALDPAFDLARTAARHFGHGLFTGFDDGGAP